MRLKENSIEIARHHGDLADACVADPFIHLGHYPKKVVGENIKDDDCFSQ